MSAINIIKENIANKTGQVNLRISGHLILDHCDELLAGLKMDLSEYLDIKISLDDVDNIDLTGLQLLYALKQELVGSGKRMIIEMNLDEELMHLVELSGFESLLESVD